MSSDGFFLNRHRNVIPYENFYQNLFLTNHIDQINLNFISNGNKLMRRTGAHIQETF